MENYIQKLIGMVVAVELIASSPGYLFVHDDQNQGRSGPNIIGRGESVYLNHARIITMTFDCQGILCGEKLSVYRTQLIAQWNYHS